MRATRARTPGCEGRRRQHPEFGFLVPLVIDRNHEIVAGHTRYKAAQSLGMKEVPCVIADELTEDQIKAFRLADNKVGEMAQWDMDLLPLELAGDHDAHDRLRFPGHFRRGLLRQFHARSRGRKSPSSRSASRSTTSRRSLILAAIKYVYDQKSVTETFGNENHNGNGLYEVVREWAALKKL